MPQHDELERKTRRSRIDPKLKSSGWEIVSGDQGNAIPNTATALTEVPTENGPAGSITRSERLVESLVARASRGDLIVGNQAETK